jgi:hypothetical protein
MNNWVLVDNVKQIESLMNQKIKMRSPIYCKSDKLCKKCMGKLGDRLKTRNIGIIAGNTIGERGTQLIMRTFHTGGKISIVVPEFINIISDNSAISIEKINEFIKISEDNPRTILSKESGILKINKSSVNNEDNKNFNSSDYSSRKLNIDVFHGTLIFKNGVLPIVLDNNGQLFSESDIIYNKENNEYTLTILKNKPIFTMNILTDDFLGKITILQQFLRATRPINNPVHLLMTIFENYRESSEMDLVYFEILVSQLMRDKDDLSKPYRLGKSKQYVFKSLKDIPKLTSYRLGMQFENIENALIHGMVNKVGRQDSPLENIYSKSLVKNLDDDVQII